MLQISNRVNKKQESVMPVQHQKNKDLPLQKE